MTDQPARYFTCDYVERTKLRDGTPILVRLLRPEDKELLRAGFMRLSPTSRYTRFFGPKDTLSDDELHYLCDIDQESHFAIGAVREEKNGSVTGLGIGRFIKLADAPDTAEAAVAVADEVQRRGLGRLLFLRMCAAARERGITKFRCSVLGSNAGIQRLLEEVTPSHQLAVTQGVCTIELVIPDVAPDYSLDTPPPEVPLYRLLRQAAENTLLDWTETIQRLWARR